MTPVPSSKQIRFLLCVGKLIAWANARGMGLTLDEGYRPKWVAERYAAEKKGIANSQHTKRLAVDLMLFIGGIYQTRSEAYAELGEFWKTLDPEARWGGDFHDANGDPAPDGDHFSFEHDGIK